MEDSEMIAAEMAQFGEENIGLVPQINALSIDGIQLEQHHPQLEQHGNEPEHPLLLLGGELNEFGEKIWKLADCYLYRAAGGHNCPYRPHCSSSRVYRAPGAGNCPYKDMNQAYPVFLRVSAEIAGGWLRCLGVSGGLPTEQAEDAVTRILNTDPDFEVYLGKDGIEQFKEDLRNIFREGVELWGQVWSGH